MIQNGWRMGVVFLRGREELRTGVDKGSPQVLGMHPGTGNCKPPIQLQSIHSSTYHVHMATTVNSVLPVPSIGDTQDSLLTDSCPGTTSKRVHVADGATRTAFLLKCAMMVTRRLTSIVVENSLDASPSKTDTIPPFQAGSTP